SDRAEVMERVPAGLRRRTLENFHPVGAVAHRAGEPQVVSRLCGRLDPGRRNREAPPEISKNRCLRDRREVTRSRSSRQPLARSQNSEGQNHETPGEQRQSLRPQRLKANALKKDPPKD